MSGKDLKAIISKIAKIDEFKGFGRLVPFQIRKLGRLKGSIVSHRQVPRLVSRAANFQIKKSRNCSGSARAADDQLARSGRYAEFCRLFSLPTGTSFTEGVILQFHDQLLRYSEKDHKRKANTSQRKSSPSIKLAATVLFNQPDLIHAF